MNATNLMNQNNGRSTQHANFILVALAFLCAGAIISAIAANQVQAPAHAAMKHGVTADQAAFCFSGGGELQLNATNPANGRCATVAKMLSKFYLRIQEPDGRDVTMFCKDKMSCIDQVKQYLRNRGYEIK